MTRNKERTATSKVLLGILLLSTLVLGSNCQCLKKAAIDNADDDKANDDSSSYVTRKGDGTPDTTPPSLNIEQATGQDDPATDSPKRPVQY